MIVIFLKFITSVTGGHFDFLPGAPKNLDTAAACPQNILPVLCFSVKTAQAKTFSMASSSQYNLILI
jgi:hypothetical protein